MIPSVNLELEKINNLFCANKLSLKVGKYFFFGFSSKTFTHYPQLSIRGRLVQLENKTKFSGVIIYNKLNLSDHIGGVCTVLCSSAIIIKKIQFSFRILLCNHFSIAIYIFHVDTPLGQGLVKSFLANV